MVERQADDMSRQPIKAQPEPPDAVELLDQELLALPIAVREPLILCELQGMSRRMAARKLNLPEGTLSSRLARGRQLLRKRLLRRGMTVTASATLALLSEKACASVPARLTAEVLQMGMAWKTDTAISLAVRTLGEGVVKAMFLKKLKIKLLVLVAVGLATGSGVLVAPRGIAEGPSPQGSPAAVEKSAYNQRVVGYIYGNEPITREDLGEFLIARYGSNHLDTLINRRIIEHACKQKNIAVTDAEVEAVLDADLKPMNLDRATFVKHFLKQYNKSLYEWKEDVIRPRLMLTKLCGMSIHVDEADLKKAFDSEFGEKVRCRIIIWREEDLRLAQAALEKIRSSETEFATSARNQYVASLASVGGQIDPVSHGLGQSETIEKISFSLKDGEVSEIFPVPTQGYAVLKCDGRIPAAHNASFEEERARLYKRVLDMKTAKELPAAFDKLKEEAKPTSLLKPIDFEPGVRDVEKRNRNADKPSPRSPTRPND
jgi:predicted DNA-binding protein (UPF0251 family)